MKLYILRHAQTHYNAARILQGHKDSLLNPAGESQARRAGARLQNVEFDAVYGSDLARCKDTAELVLEQNVTGCEPVIAYSPNFRERSLGELEGRSVDDAQALCRQTNTTFKDYGETSQSALLRMVRGFNQVVDSMDANQQQNALLVSHGSVIPRLLNHMVRSGVLDTGEFNASEIGVPHNTAITVLEGHPDKWKLLTLNDVQHLKNVETVDPLVI